MMKRAPLQSSMSCPSTRRLALLIASASSAQTSALKPSDRQSQRYTPDTVPSPPSQPIGCLEGIVPVAGRNPGHEIISVSVRSRT
jgi:hypothetical protein